MESNEHSDERFGSGSNGDKALWELLGSSREVEPSPFFARNVLREIRLSEDRTIEFSWFRALLKPAFVIGAATALILVGIVISQMVPERLPTPVAEAEQLNHDIDLAEEFASIEMLGELMAVSDPGSLSDEALMNLLF